VAIMREARLIPTIVITLAAALSFAGACGKLKPAETDGGAAGTTGSAGADGGAGTGSTLVHVTISGTAAPHPLNHALGADEDFTMLKVAILDPTATILDPNAAPLAAMALNTATTNCDATLTVGCAWSLPGVDITKQNLGLVGSIEDTRTGTARLWVKTGTGMGTKADLDAVRANPAPITDRRAFAVSRKLEAKLSAFVGTALGQTFGAGDLETRGFLIGHVVGKLSEGPMPAGVAGAKVAATGAFTIIYPNADFTSTGTTTSASGIFIMVPNKAEAVVTSWDVVPPAGDTRKWDMHLAGSNPGNAFVIILPANE
jgi:hypothetical protein